MKPLQALLLGLLAVGLLTGGQCSRARVESMNLMNEGIVYAQQQRHIDAIEALERAAAVDPTNDKAFYNLALVHLEMQKFERAKEDLNRAIAANDEVAGFQEKLGTVLMELDEHEEAKKAFEKALELDPELFKAYYKPAQVTEELDDQQEALHRYTEAAKRGPRFIPAYTQLGRLYADLGYLDHAVQVLDEGLKVAIPETEDEANLHYLLGTAYQQQRNFDDAIAEFDRALDIDPGMREALFSLGWTYGLTGNREDGRRYLKKFVEVAGAEAPEHYVKAARDRIAELGEGP
ncbi:MAG: tetratricopeptide repeat protein [Myxococcota bacterium]